MNSHNKELSPVIIAELEHLFYLYSPSQINYYLRKLLVCFVLNERDAPNYYEELVNNMDVLLDFLEIADYIGVRTDTEKAHLKDYESTEDDESEEEQEGEINNTEESSIDEVIRFIVQLVAPEKIFSVHFDDPLKNTERLNYDLIIIIPDNSQTSFKDYETLIELSKFKNYKISFSLHKSSVIHKQIAEGQAFQSIICTQENLVYDNGLVPLPLIEKGKVEEARIKSQHIFLSIFPKAISFLEGARMYFDKREFALTGFMLQQAAELTIRGVILSFLGSDIRTHSISILLKNCRGCFPQLTLIFPNNTSEEERLLELLEKSYLDTRYRDLEVNVDDLKVLFERVEILQTIAKEIVYGKVRME